MSSQRFILSVKEGYWEANWRKYIQFINEEKGCPDKLIHGYTMPNGIYPKTSRRLREVIKTFDVSLVMSNYSLGLQDRKYYSSKHRAAFQGTEKIKI